MYEQLGYVLNSAWCVQRSILIEHDLQHPRRSFTRHRVLYCTSHSSSSSDCWGPADVRPVLIFVFLRAALPSNTCWPLSLPTIQIYHCSLPPLTSSIFLLFPPSNLHFFFATFLYRYRILTLLFIVYVLYLTLSDFCSVCVQLFSCWNAPPLFLEMLSINVAHTLLIWCTRHC